MNKIRERHVQAIWYDAALRPNAIFTRNGDAVRVISPGEWNAGPGPDFRHAVLEIGPLGRRMAGDVEIHICPSDWDLHGHGVDPRYRNVIAHVTWEDGPIPDSLPQDAVSIWIGRLLHDNPAFLPEQIDLSAYPYARLPIQTTTLCEQRLGAGVERGLEMLMEAGRHRLKMKSRRVLGRLCESPSRDGRRRRQMFYEETMGALGYGHNAAPFRRVAARVPLEAILAERDSALTALTVAAGFETWDHTSLRPANRPERRLAAAAGLFTDTPILSYLDSSDFSRENCRRMVEGMCRTEGIGKGRAAAILANVILPFAIAEGRASETVDWLPPEDISQPVRLMAFRLFGRDGNDARWVGNGLMVQGLLEVRNNWCAPNFPDCQTCALVRQVGKGDAENLRVTQHLLGTGAE